MLSQLAEREERLDAAGVTVIGVATREDYQAQRLLDDGFPFPLLLDPEDSLRTAMGVSERFSPWRLLHPRGAFDYVRSARQARRFDPVWAEATQRPGMVLLDGEMRITWSHFGARIGDYPAVDEIMTAIDAGTASPPP